MTRYESMKRCECGYVPERYGQAGQHEAAYPSHRRLALGNDPQCESVLRSPRSGQPKVDSWRCSLRPRHQGRHGAARQSEPWGMHREWDDPLPPPLPEIFDEGPSVDGRDLPIALKQFEVSRTRLPHFDVVGVVASEALLRHLAGLENFRKPLASRVRHYKRLMGGGHWDFRRTFAEIDSSWARMINGGHRVAAALAEKIYEWDDWPVLVLHVGVPRDFEDTTDVIGARTPGQLMEHVGLAKEDGAALTALWNVALHGKLGSERVEQWFIRELVEQHPDALARVHAGVLLASRIVHAADLRGSRSALQAACVLMLADGDEDALSDLHLALDRTRNFMPKRGRGWDALLAYLAWSVRIDHSRKNNQILYAAWHVYQVGDAASDQTLKRMMPWGADQRTHTAIAHLDDTYGETLRSLAQRVLDL